MDRIAKEIPESDTLNPRDAEWMRCLSEEGGPSGWGWLGLSRRAYRALIGQLEAAEALRGEGLVEDEALDRLARARPVIEALARQALSEGRVRLPVGRGGIRMERIIAGLCAGGEAALTERRLTAGLEAVNDARELTMAELWAVPQALRVALCRALSAVAERILERARARDRAARWILRGKGRPRREAAFIEYALHRSGEEGLPRTRARLEAAMEGWGLAEGEVVQRAQADAARELLRLENLLATGRMLEGLRWQKRFEALSHVESELRRDASGTYERMDDASRSAVREQVAAIARRLGVPEVVVARHAADASREGAGIQGCVCWWLYEDAGRGALLARMGCGRNRLPRMIPDPRGHRTMAAVGALGLLGTLTLASLGGSAGFAPLCLPLGWSAAFAVIARLFPRAVRPARLLKLKLDHVPEDCRTLVVLPALLSGVDRVEEMCDRLEALGCLESDENLDFLLLGDFPDAPSARMPEDGEILARARERILGMNARAGREKYALLQRPRTLLKIDGVWMGRDRKRGAMMDLNRLLVNAPEAERAFSEEGSACPRLAGRFRYVITLDGDTRMLPGQARELIGAMAHPLNRLRGERGYALLQPRMEPLPSACVGGFARLFCGLGGVNAYPVSVSNLWQDLTGRGIFAGKGIYDVAAFHRRLEGALPEGRVLSHDLIEGAAAGAGFLSDVALYDGYPRTLCAYLKRLNRWTRGDWQLLALLARGRLLNGARLSGADRFRLLDNLLRSLRAPALLGLLGAALWAGNGGALLAALAVNYLEPILSLPRREERLWRRATAELAALPALAWCALDACLRTLWRLGVSGRHLLDWVTAADAEAEGSDRNVRVPCRTAAILLLPALLRPGWTWAALGVAALFWIAPDWFKDMEADEGEEELTSAQRRALTDLAGDTWRFFEVCVPEGAALPPDNVQLDPPVGAARRTSPTNIALYLLSCLSAHRLGFLELPEARRRMALTLEALERVEKWRGHLYNWIDIDANAALRPRYVSSVDSGNLAAALLACANAPETEEGVARRMEALARGMDFGALYDGERELFFIGMDVDNGRLSESRYDLLASEARILSYVAMMLGQVPPRHWQRLGRPCARVGDGVAPLSWSGTLFEYLMPLIFMPAPAHTLLGDGVRAAVEAQIRQGEGLKRPWGVSESGFNALDASLNYQYRAFGLRALALSGEATEGVVAPYAAALAVMVSPRRAAENLAHMEALGWRGALGLFEAADYLHGGDGEGPALVLSHMSHHQGMALCALCNALTGDSLRRDFMGLPQARALSPLLEEAPCALPRRAGARRLPRRSGEAPRPRTGRWANPEGGIPETWLLHGDGATALCTLDGAAHYRRYGVSATRFSGNLRQRPDRASVHISMGGRDAVLGGPGSRVYLEPGRMRISAVWGGLEAQMSVGVSPEDGTLIRTVAVHNPGNREVHCQVTDVIPVALSRDEDWRAHAAFQCLFVESLSLGGDALLFRRRQGSRGADGPALVHLAQTAGGVEWETDYERLVGRKGDPGRAGDLSEALTGRLGATLNPVSALRAALDIAPGETGRVTFALALLEGEDGAEAWLKRWREPDRPLRALRLAGTRARAAMDFAGLNPERHALLQGMAALLVDGRLAARARGGHPGEAGVSREALWSMGLSGDRPLLVMFVKRPEDGDALRELLRAHGFYRELGLKLDLALVDDGDGGYDRPVRQLLENRVAATPLHRLRGVPGGVWLLEGGALEREQRRALLRYASAAFDAREGFYVQVRRLLSAACKGVGGEPGPLETGASTLGPADRVLDNGYGGFLREGGYGIDVGPDRLPPAPWCNLLANDAGGALLSERGGGFFWRGNSRSGRLTAFGNDPLREGWGWMLYLVDAEGKRALRLLPGERPQLPFRVCFDASGARYAFQTRRVAGEVSFAMSASRPELAVEVTLENRALAGERWRLIGWVDWLMGTDSRDAVCLNIWHGEGACLATGAMGGVGYFAAADAGAGRGEFPLPEAVATSGEDISVSVPVTLKRGERRRFRLALGWAEDSERALERVRALRLEPMGEMDGAPPAALTIGTPDEALNHLANDFLMHQVRSARVLGRTGLYQPGGAYGFRDQLQDMLALMRQEPERAREHLLRCAARQFEAGDVLHWWHEPFDGVRTRISDDKLFLPWVTAEYVRYTGDAGILAERVPYLEDAPIPEGREELYRRMKPGEVVGTLHEHCMRAFHSADRRGAHGLLGMGTGDWNDGMNRIGAAGRGESVWLSQFAIACADSYRRIAPEDADRVWLWRLGEELRTAVETWGWDGEWYLRAYDDDGTPLGSAADGECRIDAISQAWAVLAGLDEARCRRAVDAAWEQLVDEDAGLIRLLTPPFEGRRGEVGYIRAYPPGVRENGGQYTHGALWLLLALIRLGDGERAHRALQMLLPYNHADTPEKVGIYRVEPYVMAADVYDQPGNRGRGGWTWYTGAAGWMHTCLLALLGYERRGSKARLWALLGDWPRASVTLRSGDSVYRLICEKEAVRVTLDGRAVEGDYIELKDDGRTHEAVFPPRRR